MNINFCRKLVETIGNCCRSASKIKPVSHFLSGNIFYHHTIITLSRGIADKLGILGKPTLCWGGGLGREEKNGERGEEGGRSYLPQGL